MGLVGSVLRSQRGIAGFLSSMCRAACPFVLNEEACLSVLGVAQVAFAFWTLCVSAYIKRTLAPHLLKPQYVLRVPQLQSDNIFFPRTLRSRELSFFLLHSGRSLGGSNRSTSV